MPLSPEQAASVALESFRNEDGATINLQREEREDAERRGSERGERAIYALQEGREIRLSGDDDGRHDYRDN